MTPTTPWLTQRAKASRISAQAERNKGRRGSTSLADDFERTAQAFEELVELRTERKETER